MILLCVQTEKKTPEKAEVNWVGSISGMSWEDHPTNALYTDSCLASPRQSVVVLAGACRSHCKTWWACNLYTPFLSEWFKFKKFQVWLFRKFYGKRNLYFKWKGEEKKIMISKISCSVIIKFIQSIVCLLLFLKIPNVKYPLFAKKVSSICRRSL